MGLEVKSKTVNLVDGTEMNELDRGLSSDKRVSTHKMKMKLWLSRCGTAGANQRFRKLNGSQNGSW